MDTVLTPEEVRNHLKLEPLVQEGGYFVETYRSEHKLPKGALPSGYPGERTMATAIYFMLTRDTFSALHKLRGDEVYHFYLGDPVELLQLNGDGTGQTIRLGHDILSGMRLQHVVPAGFWQGSRLARGGNYALLGTTMAPGFDFHDFEPGQRKKLMNLYPQFSESITQLTR